MKEDYLDQVVQIHLDSFSGYFLSFLGKNFLRVYYNGIVHHDNAIKLVYIEDYFVKGFVVGSVNPSEFYSALLKHDLFRFCIASIPSVFKRPKSVFRLLRALSRPGSIPKDPKLVELTSLAVTQDMQGRGIGKKLVGAFIDECKRRAVCRIYLMTDHYENDSVNSFYQNIGFEIKYVIETPEKRLMNEYWYEIKY